MAENVKRWPEVASLEDRYGTGFGSGENVIEPPDLDPVLRVLARCSTVEVYEELQALCPSARGAWLQRRALLFGKGWQVVEGEGPLAGLYADIMRAIVGEIQGFESFLEELHEAIWIGYGVGVVTSIQDLTVGGRTFKAPHYLRHRPAREFAFTTDRRLAWVGGSGGAFVDQHIYDTNPELVTGEELPEDLFRFIVATVGTDSPYGVGVARFVYQTWRIWRGALKDTSTGLKRALGVLLIDDRSGMIPGGGDMKGQAGYTNEEAATARSQLKDTIRMLNETGVLQFPPKITGKLEHVPSYVEQAEHALRYFDELMTRAILSVSLTTSLGAPGNQGSRAAAQVHLGPLRSLCSSDGAKISDWLNTWLWRWVELAAGSRMRPEERPKFKFLLADATNTELLAILLEGGLRIDADPLATEAGVTIAEDGAEGPVLERSAAPPVVVAVDEDEEAEPIDEPDDD